MDNRRRMAVTASAVIAVAVSMLGACATHQAATGIGRLSSGSPSSAAAPTPAVTAPGADATSSPHATTTRSPSRTATATATKASTSPSPASTDPGDYSVAKGTGSGILFCAWHDAGDGNYTVEADFTTYYRGPQHPTTVPYEVNNNINSDIVSGLTPANEPSVFGVKLKPAAQKYTLRLTLALYPGVVDDRPSDDAASYVIPVPAGSPPPGNVTVGLLCG
jgi:hypothetical protein